DSTTTQQPNTLWSLAGSANHKLKGGELQLDITLKRGDLEATHTYVVYPDSSIVREWTSFHNLGSDSVTLENPTFLELTLAKAPELNWITGADDRPESWHLKTEALAKERKFDSYDPFPLTESERTFPGDGIDAKILLNDRQIWPASGWQYVANATVTVPVDIQADVEQGDKLVFLVDMHGNINYDTTAFDPTISYDDGTKHTASEEFSDEQGRNGWRYQYLESGKYVDLVYYSDRKQWRKEHDNPTGTPFVGVGNQHPDHGQEAARIWTVPRGGHVRITASVCNTGNEQNGGGYGFRMGSDSYAPWYSLYDPASGQGLFIGWDYFGHWTSSFAPGPKGVRAQLALAGYHGTLQPGQSVTTPKAFTGLYRDDLDNAGNECLDWQYRYLWDYTRDKWFPAVRMLGYWWKGTSWGSSSWVGGEPDYRSAFLKVFRTADLMRAIGADVYHRDWGWWDRAGDWDGPDFRTMGEYLGKYGMGQLIYAFLYTVDRDSKVAKEHPDWLVGGNTLDMSRPEVVDFMVDQLDGFYRKWGVFEWRNDSTANAPNRGDDTVLLGQDEGFREVLKRFLDKHPDCAFQAVNGGGRGAGYDYARYASTIQFSDGAIGLLRNYWATLLLPPDKTNDNPDQFDPNDYEIARYRGLLVGNFDMTGDTWDPAKLEGIRVMIDIYHYLEHEGVVGRWVRVFRPVVEGDDPTMYFQRMSGDGKRGIVIPKHIAPGPVTIKPKGLAPDEHYFVSYQETAATESRTGADLMANGIHFDRMPAGELIYLNLPLHPGSKLDVHPPDAPADVTKREAENMGFPGVELRWKPGHDDNWISYYEIFRDGKSIDKVAHGTFYFDHAAGADPAARYDVRTVDGAGNTSPLARASGHEGPEATIIDDTHVAYRGRWQHPTGLLPANGGTVSFSNAKGAYAEVSFDGNEARWYSKMGADCGKAAISVDGGPPEIVDTYDADDVWGVCLWSKKLGPGHHTLRFEVLGEHNPRSSGDAVYLDGLQVR
ncbi:MAG TPA: hypothetical protein VMI31_16410, partial [Fimbriimonadaceae bacterium]|nr:hypothetical protein [Fimbriimonadaceae bacterium]